MEFPPIVLAATIRNKKGRFTPSPMPAHRAKATRPATPAIRPGATTLAAAPVYPATVAAAVMLEPVMLAAVPVADPTPLDIIADALLPVAAAALEEDAIMLAMELEPDMLEADMEPAAAGYMTAGPVPQVLLGAMGHVTFWQMDS